MLWNGGSQLRRRDRDFIFADLIVIAADHLDIYRRYYGLKVSAVLFALFYAAMALAGYLVELVFGAVGLVPQRRAVQIVGQGFAWNYTTFLNLAFLVLAALLLWRFLKTGGPAMLRHMAHAGGHDHGDGAPSARRLSLASRSLRRIYAISSLGVSDADACRLPAATVRLIAWLH